MPNSKHKKINPTEDARIALAEYLDTEFPRDLFQVILAMNAHKQRLEKVFTFYKKLDSCPYTFTETLKIIKKLIEVISVANDLAILYPKEAHSSKNFGKAVFEELKSLVDLLFAEKWINKFKNDNITSKEELEVIINYLFNMQMQGRETLFVFLKKYAILLLDSEKNPYGLFVLNALRKASKLFNDKKFMHFLEDKSISHLRSSSVQKNEEILTLVADCLQDHIHKSKLLSNESLESIYILFVRNLQESLNINELLLITRILSYFQNTKDRKIDKDKHLLLQKIETFLHTTKIESNQIVALIIELVNGGIKLTDKLIENLQGYLLDINQEGGTDSELKILAHYIAHSTTFREQAGIKSDSALIQQATHYIARSTLRDSLIGQPIDENDALLKRIKSMFSFEDVTVKLCNVSGEMQWIIIEIQQIKIFIHSCNTEELDLAFANRVKWMNEILISEQAHVIVPSAALESSLEQCIPDLARIYFLNVNKTKLANVLQNEIQKCIQEDMEIAAGIKSASIFLQVREKRFISILEKCKNYFTLLNQVPIASMTESIIFENLILYREAAIHLSFDDQSFLYHALSYLSLTQEKNIKKNPEHEKIISVLLTLNLNADNSKKLKSIIDHDKNHDYNHMLEIDLVNKPVGYHQTFAYASGLLINYNKSIVVKEGIFPGLTNSSLLIVDTKINDTSKNIITVLNFSDSNTAYKNGRKTSAYANYLKALAENAEAHKIPVLTIMESTNSSETCKELQTYFGNILDPKMVLLNRFLKSNHENITFPELDQITNEFFMYMEANLYSRKDIFLFALHLMVLYTANDKPSWKNELIGRINNFLQLLRKTNDRKSGNSKNINSTTVENNALIPDISFTDIEKLLGFISNNIAKLTNNVHFLFYLIFQNVFDLFKIKKINEGQLEHVKVGLIQYYIIKAKDMFDKFPDLVANTSLIKYNNFISALKIKIPLLGVEEGANSLKTFRLKVLPDYVTTPKNASDTTDNDLETILFKIKLTEIDTWLHSLRLIIVAYQLDLLEEAEAEESLPTIDQVPQPTTNRQTSTPDNNRQETGSSAGWRVVSAKPKRATPIHSTVTANPPLQKQQTTRAIRPSASPFNGKVSTPLPARPTPTSISSNRRTTSLRDHRQYSEVVLNGILPFINVPSDNKGLQRLEQHFIQQESQLLTLKNSLPAAQLEFRPVVVIDEAQFNNLLEEQKEIEEALTGEIAELKKQRAALDCILRNNQVAYQQQIEDLYRKAFEMQFTIYHMQMQKYQRLSAMYQQANPHYQFYNPGQQPYPFYPSEHSSIVYYTYYPYPQIVAMQNTQAPPSVQSVQKEPDVQTDQSAFLPEGGFDLAVMIKKEINQNDNPSDPLAENVPGPS